MLESVNMLFLDNPELVERIEAFCSQDPEYLKLRQEFYETAHEIAEIVGFEQYSKFESRFGLYISCVNDLYYRFGLGLRQGVFTALQTKVS